MNTRTRHDPSRRTDARLSARKERGWILGALVAVVVVALLAVGFRILFGIILLD
jgi:hypothetical protein